MLSSLQTDLAKSKEESNSFQMKLEEYQITNEIKQEIETEASEVSVCVYIGTVHMNMSPNFKKLTLWAHLVFREILI